jgi:hypothetical protein
MGDNPANATGIYMREFLKIVGVIAAVGACIWLYLKLLVFSDARGTPRRRHDPRVDPPKAAIPKPVSWKHEG